MEWSKSTLALGLPEWAGKTASGPAVPANNVFLRPTFYSASGSIGYVSGSVAYVPATHNVVFGPGGGWGSAKGPIALSLTKGWSTNPEDFLNGWSGGLCGFYGVGGCYGISTSGTSALQLGFGTPQAGVSGGYGLDWNSTSLAMYQAMPVEYPHGAIPIGSGLVYNPCIDSGNCW
jgi:hypothetical protein